MTDNAPTVEKTFQENIKERLRADIGNLLPDEVLSKLVEQSIREMFLDPVITKDRYGDREVKESWFKVHVAQLIKTRAEKVIQDYFERNYEAITTAIAQEIKERGPEMLAALITGAFVSHSYRLEPRVYNLEQQLQNVFNVAK